MSRFSSFPLQSRLSLAVCGALTAATLGGGVAPASAAGASDAVVAFVAADTAAASSTAAPSTVRVRPGQSLNDIAMAVTQSRDPVVLARASHALFDANPQAFMKRDPSRLMVGATLNVPTLEATGVAAISPGAPAASAAVAAIAAGPAGSSGVVAPVVHPASAVQPAATAPVGSATHTAPTSGAVPAGASSSSAAAAFVAAAAAPASALPPAGASGPHTGGGAIQPALAVAAASEAMAASMPNAASPGAVSGVRPALAASAPGPRPSSLQQLLALKNRALMELQKHGFGKRAPADRAEAPTPTPAPSAVRPAASDAGAGAVASSASGAGVADNAASAAQPATSPAPAATQAAESAAGGAASQIDWRIASAVGAVVVVLLAALVRRKRGKGRQVDQADAAVPAALGGAGAQLAMPESPTEPVTKVSTEPAAKVPGDTRSAAAVDERSNHEADQRPADRALTAEEAAGDAAAPPPAADPRHAFPHDAITALDSLDMPLPPRSPSATEPEGHAAGSPFVGDQRATNGLATSRPPMAGNELASVQPDRQAEGTRTITDPEPEWGAATRDIGHDAATAPAPAFGGAASHAAANRDAALWNADDPDPLDPDADESTPIAHSLPPLGGAQFGALKLDFDLDLPSSPSEVTAAFTPDELARIARNKLDLSAEYVELGDLSGARTLLQEVVDANDAGTRDDAHAMLAKLADRS
jgi:pilus assembly protein FimV